MSGPITCPYTARASVLRLLRICAGGKTDGQLRITTRCDTSTFTPGRSPGASSTISNVYGAGQALGVDDVLDVSPPWGVHPEVQILDWQEPPQAGERYGLICREYQTPAGPLRHVVRRTGDEKVPGWVVQPNHVALFEDMNIARGVRHAVAGPEDLPKLRYLLRDPSPCQLAEYRERMAKVRCFAHEERVLVLGWSAFGMDAVAWLCGVERAVIAGLTEPDFFQELIDLVYAFDRRRTEMMLEIGGVDVVVQRGWYSSTEFWSPGGPGAPGRRPV